MKQQRLNTNVKDFTRIGITRAHDKGREWPPSHVVHPLHDYKIIKQIYSDYKFSTRYFIKKKGKRLLSAYQSSGATVMAYYQTRRHKESDALTRQRLRKF